MNIHEIEEGDTIIIKHYEANAEYKLEKVDFIKPKIGQFIGDIGPVNFFKIGLASLKFEIKSDTKINIEDESEPTTKGVN